MYRDAREPLPERLKPALAECWPLYEALRAKALRPLPPDAVPRGPPSSTPSTGSEAAARAAAAATATAAATASGVPGAAAAAIAAAAASGGAAGGDASFALSRLARPAAARDADTLVGVREGGFFSNSGGGGGGGYGSGGYGGSAHGGGCGGGHAGEIDIVLRRQARVSALDAGFMMGDGVWEGLRVHRGVVLFAARHLARLWEGLKALDIDAGGLTQRQLLNMVRQRRVCAHLLCCVCRTHPPPPCAPTTRATPSTHHTRHTTMYTHHAHTARSTACSRPTT